MGSVTPYKTNEGRRYRVRFRTPDNRQTDKRGFMTRRDAEIFLASVEIAKARGEFINPSDARVTVATLGDDWLTARKAVMKPSSYRSLESAWRLHVLPRWGAWKISAVRHSDVQAWVSELAAVRSATTVLRAYGILAGIFDAAVRDRRLGANPIRDMTLPRKNPKRKSYLSHDQVSLLAERSAHPMLVFFLAYTGLRWGEASALRVRDLDPVRSRVLVSENAVMVSGTVHMGTPKSHHARSVPVPRFLARDLRTIARLRRPDEFLFGDGAEPMRLPNSKSGWFAAAVKRTMAEDRSFPYVSPHDLRHTAASLAISAGANVKAVQRMLGHASAAMTLDTYSDLFDDDLDAVSEALDRARSQSMDTGPWSPPQTGSSSGLRM
ncbi:tyrosine-type recombinase/integrase [Microbacterium sp.]|uniref:tyrosine-type recombinase/integrase n=1 Tax=Microbacterium sp. TaxID=51671 RepID=UPI0028A63251|nr:tyrosine-type recombinase/integrase [Microbacterium sp.]